MSCQTTPAKYMNTKQVDCFLQFYIIIISMFDMSKSSSDTFDGPARPVCKCQNNVRLRGKLPLSRVTPALRWGFVILTQLECYKYNILWLSDVTPANSENLWHWQNMKGVNKTSARKLRVLSKSPFWHYLAWQRKRYFTALTQFKKCKCYYCHAVCMHFCSIFCPISHYNAIRRHRTK